MGYRTGPVHLVSNSLSNCRVRTVCSVTETILQFSYFLYLFPFWISRVSSFWKRRSSTAVLGGLGEKIVVLFFHVVSFSAGAKEKGRSRLRAKSTLPSTEIFLKRAMSPLLWPWRNLCFVCSWGRFPGLEAFHFVGGSPLSQRIARGYTLEATSTSGDKLSRLNEEYGDAGLHGSWLSSEQGNVSVALSVTVALGHWAEFLISFSPQPSGDPGSTLLICWAT